MKEGIKDIGKIINIEEVKKREKNIVKIMIVIVLKVMIQKKIGRKK